MWLVGIVVRRYIDILIYNNKSLIFPTPLVLALFLAAASLLLCSFIKCFSVLVYYKYIIIVKLILLCTQCVRTMLVIVFCLTNNNYDLNK